MKSNIHLLLMTYTALMVLLFGFHRGAECYWHLYRSEPDDPESIVRKLMRQPISKVLSYFKMKRKEGNLKHR
jgi:hypothetical protein